MISKISSLFKSLFIVGCSLFFILFLFEQSLKFIVDKQNQQKQNIMEKQNNVQEAIVEKDTDIYDEYLGYAMAPNNDVNGTNSHGLRDDEIYEKLDNEFRILVTGDSQVFGLGVNRKNVLSERLEYLLNRNSNKFYNVVNAGIAGAGTDYIKSYIKHYGLELNPDYIIIGFYVNDLFDNIIGAKNKYTIINNMKYRSDNYHNADKERSKNAIIKSKFIKGTETYKLIWPRLRELKIKLKILFKIKNDPNIKGVRITKNIIKEIHDLTSKYSIPILFLFIPGKNDLDFADIYTYYLTKTYADYKPIQDYLNELGIKYLDVYEPLELNNNSTYLKDGHLNKIGHDVIARELFYYYSTRGI